MDIAELVRKHKYVCLSDAEVGHLIGEILRLTALCDEYRGEVERLKDIIASLEGQLEESRAELERLKHWDSLLCPRCHGVGEVTVMSGQTPENFSQDNIPCPDCVGPIIDERDAAVSALTRARAEGMEESAVIAETISMPSFGSDAKWDGYEMATEDIASAIRLAKDKL